MKTFISATDIEALAAQGMREYTVNEDTILTSVAREAAAQLGVKLVTPGAGGTSRTSSSQPAAVFGKPKGCQHGPGVGRGPLPGGRSSEPASSAKAASPVVDELIGAVKQLYGRNQG